MIILTESRDATIDSSVTVTKEFDRDVVSVVLTELSSLHGVHILDFLVCNDNSGSSGPFLHDSRREETARMNRNFALFIMSAKEQRHFNPKINLVLLKHCGFQGKP